ncbi:MAG: hypothetical protein IKV21_05035 [Clostridia bacterium]|nr:hypothetical protein [Clostridia bacterium]
MNKESIEIIRDTLKPDAELLEKTKLRAVGTKKMNIHIPALIAACLLVVICATFTVTGLQSRDFIPTAAVSETEEEKKEFLYSELVPSNSLKENKIERNVILSVAAFSETYLKDSVAVIEGEILSVGKKEYTVVYEFDKFENSGRLTQKSETLIIEIRADKVWYGDIKEGEIVTVETEMFYMVLPAVGRRYVLPVCDAGEEINLDEAGQTYLSGDIKRESRYSIIYPFQMQIEKTEKGYLFPSAWESLITEETKDVTVDISITETEAEYDKMKLNTEESFTEQFTGLLNKMGLIP